MTLRHLALAALGGLVFGLACGTDDGSAGSDAGGRAAGGTGPGMGGARSGGAPSGGTAGAVTSARGGAGGNVAQGGKAAQGGATDDGGSAGNAGGDRAGGSSGVGGAGPDCAPEDASAIGACEPAPFYVYNGVECVGMVGCDCVGDDCGDTYGDREACEAAHATCSDAARDCQEIADTYQDYASHSACQSDSDCVIVFGHCGTGLGGCYYALNRHWGLAGLDALAEDWAAAGCVAAVCACAAPPTSAVCLDGACAPGP